MHAVQKDILMKSFHNLFSRDERICPWWLAYTFDNPLRRILHDPRKILGEFVRNGMTVADIGCGMGYFSIAMAGMVGARGKVLAVDVQRKMLELMQKRAEKAGVRDRIQPILTSEDDLGITGPVDFILAFWMVHEVGNIPKFFEQVSSILKTTGYILYAEPRMHVTDERFQEILGYAGHAGFKAANAPPVRFSRAAVLTR
jgi:ubiquinone/menaquinone biosynthesis C-methylase UbiE